MKRLTKDFFDKSEILTTENFYKFSTRKKIVVFVPYKFIDKITEEMSNAGAGLIGNYKMCSFRTGGTGTFKPNKKAKPFSGIKNEFSYSEEYKLEMECETDQLNKVIDSVLKNHPYDEVVYEIYDFKTREKNSIGQIIHLRSKIKFSKLIERLNKSIHLDKSNADYLIQKLAITETRINNEISRSAKFLNCDCLITNSKNNFNLIKI